MATIRQNIQKIADDVSSIKTNLGLSANASLDDTVAGSIGVVKPQGTLSITENGTYNVNQYQNANVNVASQAEDLNDVLTAQGELLNSQETVITNINDALDNYGESTLNGEFVSDAVQTYSSTSSDNPCLKKLIKTLPAFDTSEWTSTAYLFAYCISLEEAPSLDTSKVTSANRMFSGCSKLKKVGNYDTSSVTDGAYMFYGCTSLLSVPNINTDKMTSLSYIFANCWEITEAPAVNLTLAKSANNLYYNCKKLVTINGELDFSNITSVSSTFSFCEKLTTLKIKNLNVTSLDLSYCVQLSHESLMFIINNLVPTETTKSLKIGSTNVAKLTEDEKAIGKAKGWNIY